MFRKIFQIYNTFSLSIKVSFWYFFCALVQKGLVFITTPIFTRLLSTEEYGIVSIFNSWEQIIIIFLTFGLANSVFNVGLVKFDNDREHFHSSMIGLETIWFLFWSLIFLAIYRYIKTYILLDKRYIILLLIHCYFITNTGMWMLKRRMEQDYKGMLIFSLINAISGTLLSLVFVFILNDKGFGKLLGTCVIAIILGVICCIQTITLNKKIIDIKYWIFAIRYNIPMLPHFLASVFLNQLDRIMIQNMCGVSKAGIYSVAYSSASIIYIFNQALSASYNPWLLGRLKKKNVMGVKEIVNTTLIIYLSLVSLIILFAPEIMRIMASSEYYDGIYVIPPVACAMFFILLFNLFAPVEHYSLKTKFIGIASGIAAILNIILNYVFINIYGYYAAGYTTLICYIIYSFAHWWNMKKCCKEAGEIIVFDDKRILIMGVIVIFIAIISTILYQLKVIRYIIIVCICFLCLIKKKNIILLLSEFKKY